MGRSSRARVASTRPPSTVRVSHGVLTRKTIDPPRQPLWWNLTKHTRHLSRRTLIAGNGRVGRMLIQHVLTGRIPLHAPVPVSIPWSRDKDGYIEGLRSYQAGDTDGWVEFFGTSIVAAVSWMHTVESSLTSLLSSLADRSRSRGASVAARVISDLPIHPLVNADTVAERYDVSRQAAHQALVRLADDGVLTERSFSRRTKAGRPRQMFTSTELLDLLSEIVTG